MDHDDWDGMDERSVCTDCIEEDDLKRFIETNADRHDCSFCDAAGDDIFACSFRELMTHISDCIHQEYDLAANNLGWSSEEGGWLGDYWDTYDLLIDQIGISLPNDRGNQLLEAMVSFLGMNDWCAANPYGENPLERLTFDWDNFVHVVKYDTRFFLSRYQVQGPAYLGNGRALPEDALRAIGDAALRMGLFTTIAPGMLLHRARGEHGAPLQTPDELGPPGADMALVSNRMSPPGIVMFYAAMSRDVALAETCQLPGGYSIGVFRTLVPLNTLDLTRVPLAPGFFATVPDSQEWNRHEAIFFRELVTDLTRPIARDDRVHLEYIATQVVVEYFRRLFHRDFQNAPPLDGVIYPSARLQGGEAVVLFCDRSRLEGATAIGDEYFGDEAKWLELVGAESVHVTAAGLALLQH